MPTITFTSGNDSYTVNSAGDYTLNFLAGDDVLNINGGTTTTAHMGGDDDLVRFQSGAATVFGETGEDRFDVWASNVTADGGADNDLFNVRGGSGQSLTGGLGDDRFNFYAAASSVLLHGNDGADDFFGYNQAIGGSIHGDAGNDYFIQFRGVFVTLYGGAGNDIYRADATSPATFVENVGEGTDSVQVARGDSYQLLANFENISVQGFSGSTSGNATLIGNALHNTINAHNNVDILFGQDGNDRLFAKDGADSVYGGNGNDYLDGGPGDDDLSGQVGNDTINGRAGADTMSGGPGDDVYYVDFVGGDVVTENASEGIDLVRVSANGFVLPANVENGIISGTAAQLLGNSMDNELTGHSGSNSLLGYDGNDTLRGGGGGDGLHGFSGNDTMQGGDGDDLLVGGVGADTSTGGAGDDTFAYLSVSESTPASRDYVTDFESESGAGGDKFDLSAIDANSNVAGNQAFTDVGIVPTGTAGDLWFTYQPNGDLMLNGDVNGDTIPDLQILFDLVGNALHADDIIL